MRWWFLAEGERVESACEVRGCKFSFRSLSKSQEKWEVHLYERELL